MTENEKTLGELFQNSFREILPGGSRYKEGGKSFRKALDHGAQAVADEAVRRWLRELPKGLEGLREAYQHAHAQKQPAPSVGWVMDWERVDAGIAAVCEVLKQRGWIDTSSLPPGDEGLAVAGREAFGANMRWRRLAIPWDELTPQQQEAEGGYVGVICEVLQRRGWIDTSSLPPGDEGLAVAGRAACHAVDPARCAAPWELMSGRARASERAYVGAVLAAHAQRLREAVKGDSWWKTVYKCFGEEQWQVAGDMSLRIADAVLARLHAEGWKTPEEAEKLSGEQEHRRAQIRWLKSEVERLKEELVSDELGIKLTWAEADNDRLRKEFARVTTQRDAAWRCMAKCKGWTSQARAEVDTRADWIREAFETMLDCNNLTNYTANLAEYKRVTGGATT